MSIQPSANQVANIYQGNPGALNARIQQDQKGKPGLPPDLTKLMALNINTNEQDAAKRQQAMTALQSMQQQGGGEPPTVAQTIQQQAMQKAQLMQQQMQQMQPKPQGLMALMQARGMPQAPENAPRPDRQPSGIDELESNIGQNFDGGGIVAFDEGGDTNKKLRQYTLQEQGADWEARRQAERDAEIKSRIEAELAKQAQMEARASAPPAPPYSGPRQVTQKELAEEYNRKRWAQQAEDAKKPEDEMLKLVKMPFKAAGKGISDLLTSMYGGKTPGAAPEQTGPDMNMGEAIMQASKNTQEATPPAPAIGNEAQRSLPSVSGSVPAKPNTGIAALVSGQRPTGVKPASVAPPAAPVVPVEKSKAEQFLESAFEKTPDQRRQEAIDRIKKELGEPDTSAQEKYIKQLDESRSRFAEPTDFEGRLSRWARNTAGAGGRSSLETGSKGAAATYAEQQSNAQKNMEALKELMGETSKVADIKRGYKEKVLAFGEKEYDDAYRNGLDAAKEQGLSGRQRELFAHQSAEKILDRKSAQIIAGMPTGEERMFNAFSRDWASKPENKGKSLSDAYAAYKLAGSPSAQLKGAITRNEASDNVAKKIAYDSPIRTALMNEAKEALTKTGIASPSATQMMDYLIDKEMGRANAPVAPTSGKVVDFGSLPK
jgi:hypothetical protein